MNYIITRSNDGIDSENELYHYGVKGMKWGIRRRTPEEKIAARVAKGEKKQAKVRAKQDRLRSDNEYQKTRISEKSKERQAIKSESLSNQVEMKRLERKIATDDFFTQRGKRKAQDKVLDLNITNKKLEDLDLRIRADIADAVNQMNVNNKRISDLDNKYLKIGRKYLGQ